MINTQKTDEFFKKLRDNDYLYKMLESVQHVISHVHQRTQRLFGTAFFNAFPKNSTGELFTDEDFISQQVELDIANGVEGAQELKDLLAGNYSKVAKSFLSYKMFRVNFFDYKLLSPRAMFRLAKLYRLDKYGVTREDIIRAIDILSEANYDCIDPSEQDYALEVMCPLGRELFEEYAEEDEEIEHYKYVDDDGDVIFYVDDNETMIDHGCQYAVLLQLVKMVHGEKYLSAESMCKLLLKKGELPND